MIRPIRVAPLSQTRLISENPLVPNNMTQEEYFNNQFSNVGSAPMIGVRPTAQPMSPVPAPVPSLLGGSAGDMDGLTADQLVRPTAQIGMSPDYQDEAVRALRARGQEGLVAPRKERTAEKVSKKVGGLLSDSMEGDAALQGLFATLTAMGRPVKRGEDRVLGAVQYGRKVYGEEMDRAQADQLNQLKMLEALQKGQPERFRLLTSDEKARMGIPEYENAQVNLSTGELKLLGGNIDYAGRAALEKQKAAKEGLAGEQARQARLYSAGSELKFLSDAASRIDELLPANDDDFSLTAGVGGQVMGALGIAGTDIVEIQSAYDEIMSKVGFGALQRMRDMSPTGGALGQVAVRELDMLQADLGKLSTKLKPSTQREKLKNVIGNYEDALLRGAQAALQDEASGEYEGFSAQEAFERSGIADELDSVRYSRTLQAYGLTDSEYQALPEAARAELPILSIDQALNVR